MAATSIHKYIKKKNDDTSSSGTQNGILRIELNTEKHIDTITLSDSDDSEDNGNKSIIQRNKKLGKQKKHNKTIQHNTAKKQGCNLSDSEGIEDEKENMANELNGDIDDVDDIEFLDEKEKILRDKIRSLPLF